MVQQIKFINILKTPTADPKEVPTLKNDIIWSRSECMEKAHEETRKEISIYPYRSYRTVLAKHMKKYMKYCSNKWREDFGKTFWSAPAQPTADEFNRFYANSKYSCY